MLPGKPLGSVAAFLFFG